MTDYRKYKISNHHLSLLNDSEKTGLRRAVETKDIEEIDSYKSIVKEREQKITKLPPPSFYADEMFKKESEASVWTTSNSKKISPKKPGNS